MERPHPGECAAQLGNVAQLPPEVDRAEIHRADLGSGPSPECREHHPQSEAERQLVSGPLLGVLPPFEQLESTREVGARLRVRRAPPGVLAGLSTVVQGSLRVSAALEVCGQRGGTFRRTFAAGRFFTLTDTLVPARPPAGGKPLV